MNKNKEKNTRADYMEEGQIIKPSTTDHLYMKKLYQLARQSLTLRFL